VGRAIIRGGELRLIAGAKFFLISRETYGEFSLEVDARIPTSGNSGIGFGVAQDRRGVRGLQADVDAANRNWAGGLFDMSRGWVAKPSRRPPRDPSGWDHYRLQVSGRHVQIWVNGVETVSHHLTSIPRGPIAFQHHGNGGVYRFRNLTITSVSASLAPLSSYSSSPEDRE
jgi:hypothetical protein